METKEVKTINHKAPVKVSISSKIPEKVEYKIKLTDSDRALLDKLDMEHRAKLVKQADVEKKIEEEQLIEKTNNLKVSNEVKETQQNYVEKATPKVVSVPNPKSKLKVSHRTIF